MISAIVPIQTPATEIPEMTLMALWDFLEIRYRFAMKKGRFNYLRITVIYELRICTNIRITNHYDKIQLGDLYIRIDSYFVDFISLKVHQSASHNPMNRPEKIPG